MPVKLCNHRRTKNKEDDCWLKTSNNRFVFLNEEGEEKMMDYGRALHWHAIRCGEEMSMACPFREWTPNLPYQKTTRKKVLCPYCGSNHWEDSKALASCASWHHAKTVFKELEGREIPFFEQGTTEDPYGGRLREGQREQLWPRMRFRIMHRDGHRCQDCGKETRDLEVHHIIPKHFGGSDHPGNLKSLCPDCHNTYTTDLKRTLVNHKIEMESMATVMTSIADAEPIYETEEMAIGRKFGKGVDLFRKLVGD